MTIEETLKALKEGKKIHRKDCRVYYVLDSNTRKISQIEKGTEEVFFSDMKLSFGGNEIMNDDMKYEIYEGCPLNKDEFEWLNAVIYPFKKDVVSITKLHAATELVRLKIKSMNDMDMYTHVLSIEWFAGMKENKEYTLEELELK